MLLQEPQQHPAKEERVRIANCSVTLRFAGSSNHAVLSSIQQILLNQGLCLDNTPKFAKIKDI